MSLNSTRNKSERRPHLVPVGAWIRVQAAEGITVVGFTYVDPSAGFSAQGWRTSGRDLDESARVIVRLSRPKLVWELLPADEISQLGLESPPPWVEENYGPQQQAGTLWGTWRQHPKLRGRLLSDHPDDLQVLVHDGGPRLSDHAPEAVWVSLTGVEGDVFSGRVLNQPFHLESVSEGSLIRLIVPHPDQHPILVTPKYLQEREDWRVHPCGKCGFTELFDAPSDILSKLFPGFSPGDRLLAFTAKCAVCGGAHAVVPRSEVEADPSGAGPNVSRSWWRFWD